MAKKYNIAVLSGDGIGPEIMREGIKVLDAITDKYGHNFEMVFAPFGAKAYFEHGHPFPEETKKVCDEADAVLKGPVGLSLQEMTKIPQEFSPEGAALLPLRARLGTYANFRPVKLGKEQAWFSPLRPELIGDGLDIMMIRELVGGIYFGKKIEGSSTDMKYAHDSCDYTREQVERIAHVAFKEAEKRNSKLTNIHKQNVLATSRFWNSVVKDVAKTYPNVTLEEMLVDNLAFQLVVNPRQFNGVVLMENMQGDIITDEAGGVLGSLGLMPTACINPETGKGYYEPAHGSAPNIAGKGIANPYSMIGSVALMLEKSFGLKQESQAIWNALVKVFGNGNVTSELAKSDTPKERVLTTVQFGDLVAKGI